MPRFMNKIIQGFEDDNDIKAMNNRVHEHLSCSIIYATRFESLRGMHSISTYFDVQRVFILAEK